MPECAVADLPSAFETRLPARIGASLPLAAWQSRLVVPGFLRVTSSAFFLANNASVAR